MLLLNSFFSTRNWVIKTRKTTPIQLSIQGKERGIGLILANPFPSFLCPPLPSPHTQKLGEEKKKGGSNNMQKHKHLLIRCTKEHFFSVTRYKCISNCLCSWKSHQRIVNNLQDICLIYRTSPRNNSTESTDNLPLHVLSVSNQVLCLYRTL